MAGDCDNPGITIASWNFVYDGDGNRVEQEYTDGNGTLTTYYFFGGAYEVQDDGATETIRKYYAFAGQTIAMRDGEGLKYFLTDHLGSVVAVTDENGERLSQQRYLPFGEIRSDYSSISLTDYGYTFQRALDQQGNQFTLGLMDYKARFYSPALGRFTQPDTIVPNPGDTQAWNRYSYVNNNPVMFMDPTGHYGEEACIGVPPTIKSQCLAGVDKHSRKPVTEPKKKRPYLDDYGKYRDWPTPVVIGTDPKNDEVFSASCDYVDCTTQYYFYFDADNADNAYKNMLYDTTHTGLDDILLSLTPEVGFAIDLYSWVHDEVLGDMFTVWEDLKSANGGKVGPTSIMVYEYAAYNRHTDRFGIPRGNVADAFVILSHDTGLAKGMYYRGMPIDFGSIAKRILHYSNSPYNK